MTRLRILLYANCDGGLIGGVQSVVRDLARFLEGRGHAVSTGWSESNPEPGVQKFGWAEQFPVRNGHKRWFHLPTGARLLWRLLRERPHIVHVHFASSSVLYFNAFAKWLPFRVILTCHGSDIMRPHAEDKPHLETVLRHADLVTAVSPAIHRRLQESRLLPKENFMLVPNGIDTEFWHPLPAPRPENAEPELLTVGRLEPVKGHDLLIAACGLLAARGRPCRLVIVGEGAERAALERQAAAAGIADRVIFAGSLPPGAIRERLHAADLFVLPSRSEGMPLALLEAMATGTACIAARVGGVPELAGEAARLVGPEDPQALAAAIAELADAPALMETLGERGRARALDFSVARTNAAYEAAMLALARAPRPRTVGLAGHPDAARRPLPRP